MKMVIVSFGIQATESAQLRVENGGAKCEWIDIGGEHCHDQKFAKEYDSA